MENRKLWFQFTPQYKAKTFREENEKCTQVPRQGSTHLDSGSPSTMCEQGTQQI